jgi:hypothetical protein
MKPTDAAQMLINWEITKFLFVLGFSALVLAGSCVYVWWDRRKDNK